MTLPKMESSLLRQFTLSILIAVHQVVVALAVVLALALVVVVLVPALAVALALVPLLVVVLVPVVEMQRVLRRSNQVRTRD